MGLRGTSVSPLRVSCCQVLYTFHTRRCILSFCRHAWPVDKFVCPPQACLYSEVGRVNLQLHICAKPLRYHDGIPFEDQAILYGQVITHAEVRVCQCWASSLLSGHPTRIVSDNYRRDWFFRVSALISSRRWSDMSRYRTTLTDSMSSTSLPL